MEKHSSHRIKINRTTCHRLGFAVLIVLFATILIPIILVNKLPELWAPDAKDDNSAVDASCEDITETPCSDTIEPTEKVPALTKEPKPITQPTLTNAPSQLPTVEPSHMYVRINGPIRNEDITFLSRGVQVTATVCMPETITPCPVVVLAHGFGGEKHASGGFTHIANALYDKGVASIRCDFSGCGNSSEPSTAYCLTEMMLDIKSAAEYMTKNYYVDDTKLGLIGYSLGGRAVLEVLADSMIEPYAVMLIAPAASTSDFVRLIGGESIWKARRAEAFESGKTNLAGMDLGYAFFREMDEHESPTIATAASYCGKTAVVYSSDDQAVSPQVSSSVAEVMNSQSLVLNGAGHDCGFHGGPDNQYLSQIIAFAIEFFGGK